MMPHCHNITDTSSVYSINVSLEPKLATFHHICWCLQFVGKFTKNMRFKTPFIVGKNLKLIWIFLWHSRSPPFPEIPASHSCSQIRNKYVIPVPEHWECTFQFFSVPKSWEYIVLYSIQFPFPKFENSQKSKSQRMWRPQTLFLIWRLPQLDWTTGRSFGFQYRLEMRLLIWT